MSAQTRNRKLVREFNISYEILVEIFQELDLDSWTPDDFIEFLRLYKTLPHEETKFHTFVDLIRHQLVLFNVDDVSDKLQELLHDVRYTGIFSQRYARVYPGKRPVQSNSLTRDIKHIIRSWDSAQLMKLVYFCKMKPDDVQSPLSTNFIPLVNLKIRFREVEAAMNIVKVKRIMEL